MDLITLGLFDNMINVIGGLIVVKILFVLLVIAIFILVIRLICQYQAKMNAREFDYGYLAECIAKEMKRDQVDTAGDKSNLSDTDANLSDKPNDA